MREKLLIPLLAIILFATPVCAAPQNYRVISDLMFETEAQAIFFVNLIETHKDKLVFEDTISGFRSWAKFVESWDTELVKKPQHTRFHIDMDGAKLTHVVVDIVADQGHVNTLQARLDAKQAQINKWQIIINTKQAEIDALTP